MKKLFLTLSLVCFSEQEYYKNKGIVKSLY